MELTEKDKAIINDLVNIAWQSGALRSPQMATDVEQLRAKIMKKEELKKVE